MHSSEKAFPSPAGKLTGHLDVEFDTVPTVVPLDIVMDSVLEVQ